MTEETGQKERRGRLASRQTDIHDCLRTLIFTKERTPYGFRKNMVKWGVLINRVKFDITFIHSTASGKRSIFVNGDLVERQKKFLEDSSRMLFRFECPATKVLHKGYVDHISEVNIKKRDCWFFLGSQLIPILCVFEQGVFFIDHKYQLNLNGRMIFKASTHRQ